jgi:hypothetical protein
MRTFLFKSNPRELSTFAVLLQMLVLSSVGLGVIITIFQTIANAR